jgi:hypothetical protein
MLPSLNSRARLFCFHKLQLVAASTSRASAPGNSKFSSPLWHLLQWLLGGKIDIFLFKNERDSASKSKHLKQIIHFPNPSFPYFFFFNISLLS